MYHIISHALIPSDLAFRIDRIESVTLIEPIRHGHLQEIAQGKSTVVKVLHQAPRE